MPFFPLLSGPPLTSRWIPDTDLRSRLFKVGETAKRFASVMKSAKVCNVVLPDNQKLWLVNASAIPSSAR